MGLASGVRNRDEGVGRAGCSPLHENLGVMGSCLVLWVKRAGVGGVGILNGSGGSSFIFLLVYWVWLGVGVSELFSPGKS